jgi:23S rRNA pseudouridine1911/1915/1917 synthase
MSLRLAVLYEDNHLLAVNKPAVLPTMGVAKDQPSLVTAARAYLKAKYAKPGNVYLGVVSRLDSVVTGVVLFARTSKAAARLTEQFRSREVEKTYWAIVEGMPDPPAARCDDWVIKNEAAHKIQVVGRNAPGAQEAILSYRTLSEADAGAMLEVQLQSGRKHQIRVQLAHRGHPILGDRKYGARTRFTPGIALHARQLELTHPVRKTPLSLVAPLPDSWRSTGIAAEYLQER